MEEQKREIIKIISEQLGIPAEEISEESNFASDLNMDQLELTDLVLALEKKFEVEIPAEEIKNIQTVGDLLENIINRLDESP
ncbi:acyl carrier protein [Candidatus Microgenomates bacterium]|nr:acyl carrier protein [Candidatus Microgenomates bacterium]